MDKISSLSYSSLREYEKAPTRFYLSRWHKIKKFTLNESMKLGTAFDKKIKLYLTEKFLPNKRFIVSKMEEEPTYMEKVIPVYEKYLTFMEKEKMIWEDVEVNSFFNMGNVPFQVKIDALVKDKANNVMPLDWKYSAAAPKARYFHLHEDNSRVKMSKLFELNIEMKEIDEAWSDQCIAYSLFLGQKTDSSGVIHQICNEEGKIRLACFMGLLTETEKIKYQARVDEAWYKIHSGEFEAQFQDIPIGILITKSEGENTLW